MSMPPTSGVRKSKGVLAKNKLTWKFAKTSGNIMEFCRCGEAGTLLEKRIVVRISAA